MNNSSETSFPSKHMIGIAHLDSEVLFSMKNEENVHTLVQAVSIFLKRKDRATDFHSRTFYTIAVEGLEILREVFQRAKSDEITTFDVFLDQIMVSNRSSSKSVRDLYFNTMVSVTYDHRDVRGRYLSKARARNEILHKKVETHFSVSQKTGKEILK